MQDRAGPPGTAETVVTFFHYRDLPGALAFDERVPGARLVTGRGRAKICRQAGAAHPGPVDERRGAKRAAPARPVQLCLPVADAAAGHGRAAGQGVPALAGLRDNPGLGLRLFTFEDAEGCQIEIRPALPQGRP